MKKLDIIKKMLGLEIYTYVDDKECQWIEDDDGVWETSCNDYFQFNDGGPHENGFLFCPYCGKKLKQIRLTRRDV